MYATSFFDLPRLKAGRSGSINWENRDGAKGGACRAASVLGPSRKGSPCIPLIRSGETVTLMDLDGPGEIQHIWMTVAGETPAGRYLTRDLVLRMYWDGSDAPSVEVPLGDFFLNGFGRTYPVNSALICVNPKRGMNSYIPMPFARHARVTLENQHAGDVQGLFFQIDYVLCDEPLPEDTAFFHAQWRRQAITRRAEDYVLLDGVRGRGHLLGVHLMLQTLERCWWGEGEMKFYIDGDRDYPTQCSTGTEDYFGGAWSFGGTADDGTMREETYCTPFAGYPFYSRDDDAHSDYWNRDVPPMRSFYRWHVPDPILFRQSLRVELQQIGVGPLGLFERSDDVTSVAYWYQTLPHAAFPALPDPRDRWPR